MSEVPGAAAGGARQPLGQTSCGIGFLSGQRPSLAEYVTATGTTDGAISRRRVLKLRTLSDRI